jgi:hypothetical protein
VHTFSFKYEEEPPSNLAPAVFVSFAQMTNPSLFNDSAGENLETS